MGHVPKSRERDFQLRGHSARLAGGCGRFRAIVSHEQYQRFVDAERANEASNGLPWLQKIVSLSRNARTESRRPPPQRSVCSSDNGLLLFIRIRKNRETPPLKASARSVSMWSISTGKLTSELSITLRRGRCGRRGFPRDILNLNSMAEALKLLL